MKHITGSDAGVVTVKLSPSMVICSYCHVFKDASSALCFFFFFFTLQETLKQHFIPILLPRNTFSRGEFNIFLA